jgi:hypothetical protein
MVAQLLYSSEFFHGTLYRELLGYSLFLVRSERKVAIKTAKKLDRAYNNEQFFIDRRTRRQYCERLNLNGAMRENLKINNTDNVRIT